MPKQEGQLRLFEPDLDDIVDIPTNNSVDSETRMADEVKNMS